MPEEKPLTPYELKNRVDNLRKKVREILESQLKPQLPIIANQPLDDAKVNSWLETITDSIIEKTPYLNFKEDAVAGGFFWETFQAILYKLKKEDLIPLEPGREHIEPILIVNQQFDHIANYAEEVSKDIKKTEEGLQNECTQELQQNLNLKLSTAQAEAKKIADETWLELYNPKLKNLPQPEFQEKFKELLYTKAESVLKEDGYSTAPLSTITENVSQKLTPNIEALTSSSLLNNSRNQYEEIFKVIKNEAKKVTSEEKATEIAEDLTSQSISSMFKATKFKGEERENKGFNDVEKIITDRLEKNYKYNINTDAKLFAQDLSQKINPLTGNYLRNLPGNTLPDQVEPMGQAFGIIYSLFDADYRNSFIHQGIPNMFANFFALAAFKEETPKDWAIALGQKRIAKTFAGDMYAGAFRRTLFKGTTAKTLNREIELKTGDSFYAYLYRTLHNQKKVSQFDSTMVVRKELLNLHKDFEKTWIGKILAAHVDLKQAMDGEWNVFGLDILKLKVDDLAKMVLHEPEAIPSYIARQLGSHLIAITVKKALNRFGLWTKIYKIQKLPTGVNIIVFDAHNQLIKFFIKKPFGLIKTALLDNEKIRNLLQTRLVKGLNNVLKLSAGTFKKYLARIIGLLGTTIGTILALKDIIQLIKKILQKIGGLFAYLYLLLVAKFGALATFIGAMSVIPAFLIGFPLAGMLGLTGIVAPVIFAIGFAFVVFYVVTAIASYVISFFTGIGSSSIFTSALTALHPVAFATAFASLVAPAAGMTAGAVGGSYLIQKYQERVTNYIDLSAETSPQMLTNGGESKFTIEFKSGIDEVANLPYTLRDITIKQTFTITSGDSSKEITPKKENIDTGKCNGLDQNLSSLNELKPNGTCTFSFTINFSADEYKNSTISDVITVDANIYTYSGIIPVEYAGESVQKTQVVFVIVGSGGLETIIGQPQTPGAPKPIGTPPFLGIIPPSTSFELLTSDLMPKGWPLKESGIPISQGPNTCPSYWSSSGYYKNFGRCYGPETNSHPGQEIDIAVQTGHDVYSTHPGAVFCGKDGPGSFYAIVQVPYKDKIIYSGYWHLIPGTCKPSSGIVPAGTLIGKSGWSGLPSQQQQHLHYVIFWNGTEGGWKTVKGWYGLNLPNSYTIDINTTLPKTVPTGCVGKDACKMSI